MFNDNFIKTAGQLQSIDQKEVVKVASLVRKLKNLWKSITNTEYRESVSLIQNNAGETQSRVSELNKKINELSSAIKDGDLKDYTKAITEVKKSIDEFMTSLTKLERQTNVLFQYTSREMSRPGFLENMSKGLPSGYDVELNKKYEKTPLRNFNWYKNRKYDLFFGSNPSESEATKHLIDKTLNVLNSYYEDKAAFQKEFFTGKHLESFITAFTQAVFGGYLIEAKPHRPKRGETSKGGTRELTIRTLPFEISGAPGATIIATVVLVDNIGNRRGPARMSLRKTKNVELSNNPINLEASNTNDIIKFALQIPYRITKLSEIEFAQALREGYKRVFGNDPTAETLAGAWSQAVLESGRPVKLPNNNVGNIKATSGWVESGKPFFTKDTAEYTNSGEKYISHAAKWRAYPDAAAGAAGYWGLIGNRYKQAMSWMSAGDPTSASVALGLKGYFTANIRLYAKGVTWLYKHFMEKIAPQLLNLQSSPTAAPGEKPQVKNWRNEYSKEEKESILLNSVDVEQDEVNALMNQIAPGLSPVSGLLTKLVKKSFLNAIPDKYALITLSTDGSVVDKIEYALVTSSIINKGLNIQADVCVFNNNVEIACIGKATESKLEGALQEVCDIIASKMMKKTNIGVFPTVLAGYQSDYSELDIEDLLANRRAFNMKRIMNG